MKILIGMTLLFYTLSGFTKSQVIKLKMGKHHRFSKVEFHKQKLLAESRIKRKISSDIEPTDDLMSVDLKAFRAMLIGTENQEEVAFFKAHLKKKGHSLCSNFQGLKTKQDVDKCLNYLDQNYEGFADDLKFFSAQLIPLLSFRSFAYRIRPLLLKKENVTHNIIVTKIYNLASLMKVNLPSKRWEAGFKFITEPIYTEDYDNRIYYTEEVQEFLIGKVYLALTKAALRIKELDFSGKKIVWDNKMLFGVRSFPVESDMRRYQYIGQAEKFAVLGGLYAGLSGIAMFNAYNIKNLMKLSKELGSLYGLSGLFSKSGITAKKVKKIFTKTEYKKLFTMRDNGQNNIDVSFELMQISVDFHNLAWIELEKKSPDNSDVFNSIIVGAIGENYNKRIDKVKELLEGETSLVSNITGEEVKVNLPAFYANAPQDLKKLLPISFDSGDRRVSEKLPWLKKSSDKAKEVTYQNYFRGRAIAWDKEVYKTLFPGLNSGADVAKFNRIVNESTGSFPMASLLNLMMQYSF